MDCWKHLPLKKGLRGKDLKSNGEKENYWIEKLKHAGIIFPCCDIDDCPCSLVPKIHERTLAVAVSNTDVEWSNSLNNETNPAILADYLIISKEIRSWLCIGSPIRS